MFKHHDNTRMKEKELTILLEKKQEPTLEEILEFEEIRSKIREKDKLAIKLLNKKFHRKKNPKTARLFSGKNKKSQLSKKAK